MGTRSWPARSLVAFGAAALAGVLGAQARVHKLSGELGRTVSKDVDAFRVSQEGYVLYTRTGSNSDAFARTLFSAPADGSAAPTILSERVEVFDVTPDGSRAVFLGLAGLFVRGIDGAAPTELVGNGFPPGDWQGLALSSDGLRAVCRVVEQDEETFETYERLFSVDLDGSGWRRIDGGAFDSGVQAFVISPDGSSVAYHGFSATWGIHVVPVDGSQSPLQVSTGFSDFLRFSSDGQHVLFDSLANGLYSVPSSGGPPVLLNPGTSLLNYGPPASLPVVAGDFVYFLARGAVAGIPHLYRAPVDGSAPAFRLDAPFTAFAGAGVHAFRLLAGETYVVYAATVTAGLGDQLFRVSTDGSQVGVELSGPLASGGGVAGSYAADGFAPSPDGTRVAFVADSTTDELFELLSVPSDGSAAPVRLGSALVPGADVEPGLLFTPNGQAVLYRIHDPALARTELHIAASATAGASARLSDEFVPGGEALDVVLGPGGQRAFYRADRERDEALELFSVRLTTPGTPVRLSEPLDYVVTGDVRDFFVAPDGGHVAYLGLLGNDSRQSLHARELRGLGRERNLTDSVPKIRDVLGFSVDGRIVYTTLDSVPLSVVGTYSAPLDGSAPPVALTQAEARYLSPDGRWIVFGLAGNPSLLSASTDGASGEVVLGTTGQSGSIGLAPDNTHVLFVARDTGLHPFELYSTRLDGTATPQRISAPLVSGVGASFFRFSPDGTAALYFADDRVDEQGELFIASVDGSFPARRLNGPLAASGAVWMALFTPDGTRVAYAAQQDGDAQVELYSVPSDGSLPALRLTSTGVGWSSTRLSDTHAYFPTGAGLFRVPLDGSALPELLTTAFNIRDLTLTPDGSRLVFLANSGLFSVLADGSAGALLRQDVSTFQLSRNGASVVFSASGALFGVPVVGGTTPTRLSAGLVESWDYTIAPDGSRVLFLAQEDSLGPRELYQSFLLPAHRAR